MRSGQEKSELVLTKKKRSTPTNRHYEHIGNTLIDALLVLCGEHMYASYYLVDCAAIELSAS